MTSTALTPVQTLPDDASPYLLEAGGGTSGLLIGQTIRILAGGAQTGGRMAIVSVLGPKDHAIPFHFHRESQDSFYITRGQVQLWAGEESRVLSEGDFGYVAPGTNHSYGFLAPRCETIGLITPGGWEEFFKACYNDYSGSIYPPVDKTPPPFEKLGRAQASHDVSFQRDLKPFPVTAGADDTLPGGEQSYFLKAGYGPRHVLLGQISTQLISGTQTSGKFGISVIEGPRGALLPRHHHAQTHEVLHVLNGRVRVNVDGQDAVLNPGDTLSLPPGSVHGWTLEGYDNRLLSFNAHAGTERLFEVAGAPWEYAIYPDEHPAPGDEADLKQAAADLDIIFAE